MTKFIAILANNGIYLILYDKNVAIMYYLSHIEGRINLKQRDMIQIFLCITLYIIVLCMYIPNIRAYNAMYKLKLLCVVF